MVQHPRRRGLVVNDLAAAGPCYVPFSGQILDEWILEGRAGAIFWLLRDVRRSKALGGEHGAGVTQTFGLRFAGSSINELRSEEHTSELQSLTNLVCRLLLEKKETVAVTGASSGRSSYG